MAEAEDKLEIKHPESSSSEEAPDPTSDTSKKASDTEPKKTGSGGLLSFAFDPIGRVAEKGLSPLGTGLNMVAKPVTSVAGSITKPVIEPGVEAGRDLQREGQRRREEEKEKRKPVGGLEQTGGNPLGLV